jgi:ring-1,2-phenylacetyl-CoA epoxidase subunit PaaD
MLTSVEIEKILSEIPDPEIPVINIKELGILRKVKVEGGKVLITVTPTYSGCPAMRLIEDQIKEVLHENKIESFVVKSVLSPAWTTDWITDEAKQKLEDYGIAPPEKGSPNKSLLDPFGPKDIRCPHCKSKNVKMVSQFGSTACKAHYKCIECLEPFDYFKCI